MKLPGGRHFHHRDMTTAINSTPETVAHRNSKPSVPAVLGVGNKIGEDDTYLVENVLPPELAEVVLEKVDEGSRVERYASSRFVGLPIIWAHSPSILWHYCCHIPSIVTAVLYPQLAPPFGRHCIKATVVLYKTTPFQPTA